MKKTFIRLQRLNLLLLAIIFSFGSNLYQLQAQSFSENFDDISLLPGNGWALVNASSPVGSTDWFQGNSGIFPAYNGVAAAYIGANFNNTSGTGTISNWLMSPVRTFNNGDVISFYTRTNVNPSTFPDRLRLMLSTNGNSTATASFTTTLLSVNAGLTTSGYPSVWTQYTATLSGLPGGGVSGRFALWYDVTNAGPSGSNSDYIGIDNVVYTASPPTCPSFSGAPDNVSITNSTCSINVVSGGSITAPGGMPCPAGSTLQYNVNNTGWTSTLPDYNQTGPVQSIVTRCSCDNDANTVSAESTAVTTVPGSCGPANDLCANATPISCGTTISSSNINATAEPGSFAPCGVVQTTAGVWYTFTGDGTTVTLSTCSAANFDTKISVYTGGCATPTCVTGNDDACPSGRSTVTFVTTNGTVYLILIHGFGGATGTFDLTMSCAATCPSFSFTGNGDSSVGDNAVNVSLCSGGNLTLSAFTVSSPTAQIHEVLTATPGLLYGASPITNATQNITAAAAPGYFGSVYGPYNNTTNAPGTITQVITPYEELDGTPGFSPGDCAGTPVTLTITVNPKPKIAFTFNNPTNGFCNTTNTICNGGQVNINLTSGVTGLTEGTDFRFENVVVRYKVGGTCAVGTYTDGYGPVTGGTLLAPGQILTGTDIVESLSHNGTDIVWIQYNLVANDLSSCNNDDYRTIWIGVNPKPKIAFTFNNPTSAFCGNPNTICNGDQVSIDMTSGVTGLVEGTDFEFRNVVVRHKVGGTCDVGTYTDGYGPVTGGTLLTANQVLTGTDIVESLSHNGADIVWIQYNLVAWDLSGCGNHDYRSIWIGVKPTPRLQTSINGQVVTSNNDGTPDEGAFTVCNGASNNVVINSFSELQGITPSTNLRVYQTVALTNASLPYCNNCQALLSDFTPGLSATLALVNPAMPGSAVVTFQLWNDISPANGSIDPGECIGDVIRYTITINPVPTIAFTAQVTGRAAQNGNSATPTNVVLNFCAGESFSYSNYVSVPGNRVGVLEVLTGTGNVTYNGASVSVPRTQLDFGVGGTPGYFAGTYGPYGLSSGVSGNFVETFTPYYDSDNSGTYTPGDCLGNPVTITYNVYALPNAIATPSSQAICNNSATSIALSSNVPGTTFSWVVQSTTGTVTGQTGGNGPSIAQTLNNSGATPATVTYRITPTGPGPNNCVGPTTDVTVTVAPSPTVTCPASFTVNTSTDGTGNCSGTANWTHPTIAAGPCGPVTLTMSVDGGAPAAVTPGMAVSRVLTVGPHTVAYVVSDGKTPNPNTATCSFGITVVDDELPMVTCKPYSISFNGQDSLPVTAANLVLSSSDNCGIASTVLQYNKIGCQSVGTVVPVVVTVTDVNGLSNSCMANVTVGGLPCGWSSNSNSIGCTSNVVFTPGTGLFTTTASSCFYANPFTVDDVSFIQRRLCGDGSITALVTGISGSALGWAGVVMRESNVAGAKKAQLTTNLSSFSRREFRTTTNGQAYPQQFPSQNRYWLRIVRAGNEFTMYVSPNGIAWFFAGTQNIVMDNCIQMGLVATNYTANSTVTATFSGVSFSGSNAGLGSGSIGQSAESIEGLHSFEVYPNPTGGELNVDLTNYVGRAVRLEVYSLEGKLLQFSEVDAVETHIHTLDMSKLHTGMYLIRVKSAGIQDAVQKAVLQRK